MGNIVFDRMLKRIREGNLRKEDWEEDLYKMEITIDRYLNEKGYAYEERYDFRNNAEENLKLIMDKEKMAQEHPIMLLPEGVKNAQERFGMLLDSYHIGFIHDFRLDRNGLFEVKISLHIYPPSTGLGKNDVSERDNYESGLKRLQEMGMILDREDKKSIKATEMNKKIILDILGLICEPKAVRLSSRGEDFDIIHFFCRPESIKDMVPIEKNPITEEMVRQDKIIRIERHIKELMDAIGTINSMPELTNTCGYIVEGAFTDICDLLEVNTEISSNFHKRHAKTREMNKLIKHKEMNLGGIVQLNQVQSLAKELFTELSNKLRDGIGYRLNDDTGITRYNGVKISVDCIPSCCYYDAYIYDGDNEKNAMWLETHMEGMYDMIEPFQGERYVAFTNRNLAIISRWVRDTYNTNLEDIRIENRNGGFYIKTISFYINDMSKCLSQTSEECITSVSG